MSSSKLTFSIIALFAFLLVLSNTLFVVPQTQQALVLQFGRYVTTHTTPGLKIKIPFLQNVEFYDARVIDFNALPKEVIAADQKRLILDAFVRYRITDPLKFKQTVGNEATMNSRLNSILESSLRQALGNVPLSAVISSGRDNVMQQVKALVNQQVKGIGVAAADGVIPPPRGGFGIDVIDVRIVRADLPLANSESIYRRMQTERDREAKEFRANGAEDAQKIRSQAEKERTIILAEARRKSEVTRGEGDSQATKIFADATSQDPEFFQFYRSLQAYKKALSSKDTTMVLSPDNEFLKYMEKGAK